MQSDFSEIPLFTGYLSFLNNITAFIRQTELCGAPHNSVAIPCVEFIMRGIAMAFGVYPAALPDFSEAFMSGPAGDNTSSLSRGR